MYVLNFIREEIIDDQNKFVYFECEKFEYHARCFENILQYVKGERPESYLNWSTPPTSEEIQGHEERRHIFNNDHTIIQDWLDSL